MRHHLAIVALPFFLLAAQALAEGEKAGSLKDELAKTLNRYIKALQDGDVQTYRELRESAYLKRQKEFLAKKGRELTPETLKPRNPKVYTRLTAYPVIEAIRKCHRRSGVYHLAGLRMYRSFLSVSFSFDPVLFLRIISFCSGARAKK